VELALANLDEFTLGLATNSLLHSLLVLLNNVTFSSQQPGPFPVAHVDMAQFSLEALLTEKLYNTCPYVVADGF
jgi:hypothetical protein